MPPLTKKMTKKNELLIIPKEICIIISEYSACKCRDCNRNNNRKYFTFYGENEYEPKDIDLFHFNFRCRNCAIKKIKRDFFHYRDGEKSLNVDDIMASIQERVEEANKLIEFRRYYSSKNIINYNHNYIKEEVIKNVNKKIKELLNEYFCNKVASPNEIIKLLMKI